MYFKTMPQIIMKKKIFIGKFLLTNNSFDTVFNRNWVKNDSKGINYVLKLKISELVTHVFCKTGANRNYV
jgi:hypothetical protein